jgi:hypothetical protein
LDGSWLSILMSALLATAGLIQVAFFIFFADAFPIPSTMTNQFNELVCALVALIAAVGGLLTWAVPRLAATGAAIGLWLGPSLLLDRSSVAAPGLPTLVYWLVLIFIVGSFVAGVVERRLEVSGRTVAILALGATGGFTLVRLYLIVAVILWIWRR